MVRAVTVFDAQAEESIAGGEDVDLPRGMEAWSALAGAFGQGRVVARTAARLGVELAKIAVGRSAVAPVKTDRRFADPAWSTNPLYHRIEQTYLASGDALGQIVDEWRRAIDDPRRAQMASFAATIATSAAAPTNFLATNPAALKEAFDTGGISLVRGLGNYLSDLRHNGGMPSMVEPGAFTVGTDLALTPGAVVARDEVAEVLQYAPTTDTVHERPVLVVPPPIGRFYFLDLRPGRSFVEYAVSRGLQTFLMSLAQPATRTGPLEPGHLRRAGVGGDRPGPRDHRQRRRERHRVLRRRHHRHDTAQPLGRAGR